MEFITNEKMLAKAPSIFTVGTKEGLSKNYKQYKTCEVLEAMKGEGWWPVRVQQRATRIPSKEGFQKHMVRLRKFEHLTPKIGTEVFPELILTNSHDGFASYKLQAGLYRQVCSNGLCIGDGMISSINIRHVGFDPSKVIEASYEIVKDIPNALAMVEGMKAIDMSTADMLSFANEALTTRFDASADIIIDPQQVLSTRRYDDKAPTLWNTFNKVQENIIKGGIEYMTIDSEGKRHSRKARAVKSIGEDIRINQNLWALAETYMGQLKH